MADRQAAPGPDSDLPGLIRPAASPPGEAVSGSSLARASAMLASGTLVSRMLGLVSLLILTRTLGLYGAGGDAFSLANQLPKSIYAIVAGGILSAVIVPQIVRTALHADGGQKFMNRLVTLGMLVFIAVTVVATFSAPLLVRLYAADAAPGEGFDSDQLALATAFAYWCLPQVAFYALYAVVGEVLNARGVFGPFTWAPVANNVVMIAGLILFNVLFGGANGMAAADWTVGMITVLAGGATLGIVVQALILAYFWRRSGLRYRPEFRWRGVGLGDAGRAAGWTFGMILVTQLAGIIDSRVSSVASGEASIFVMATAWLLFMLPHSIIAVSIGMPYFTKMSASARDDDETAVSTDLSSSLRAILLLLVFSAVGLMVLAFPLASLFSREYVKISSLAIILIVYLAGLIPFSAMYLLQRVFFALGDTRTPFLLQGMQVLVFAVGAIAVSGLPREHIAIALAGVLSVAGTIQTVVATAVIRRRLPGTAIGLVGLRTLWFLAAMVPAAAAGAAIVLALGGLGPSAFPVGSEWGSLVSIGLAGIGMLAVYSLVLWLTRNPEFTAFAGPIIARVKRARK